MAKKKIRMLCVDDESSVLEGLERLLRRECEMTAALDGPKALELIQTQPAFEVVISDMRMPGMDGAAFLSQVHKISPDSTRMLLTGYADLDSAISAVNDGQIFRFLTKPCPPAALRQAVTAAAEQYRLVTSEKVLLEQTLSGAINMLAEVLAVARPKAFGRASRLKVLVNKLARKIQIEEKWSLDVATILSQVGLISLPPELADKAFSHVELTPDEQKMVDEVDKVAESLLANIPRLEKVTEILAHQNQNFDGSNGPQYGVQGNRIPLGARILKVVLDFDQLKMLGNHTQMALDVLHGRTGVYDPTLLEAFTQCLSAVSRRNEILELPVKRLRIGMILLNDIMSTKNAIMVAKDSEISESLLALLLRMPSDYVKEPIKVMVRSDESGKGGISEEAAG